MSSSDVEKLKAAVRDLKLQIESMLARIEDLERHCWPLDAVAKTEPPGDQPGEFPQHVYGA